MAEYPFVRMGDFLRERKEFITIDDMEVYKRAKVQWYGKGTILRDKVPGVDIKTKKQQVIRSNEFVVAEIDAKDGSFGVTPEELDGAIVSSHYFVYEIDQSLCLPSYLEWYVRTNNLQASVKAQGSTNYSAIRSYTVYDYKIPLPPLKEQRRIVEDIESLAARVNEAQRLREEADEETNALIASARYKACIGEMTSEWRQVNHSITPVSKMLDHISAQEWDNHVPSRKRSPMNLPKPPDIPDTWKTITFGELQEIGAILEIQDGNHGGDYPRQSEFSDDGIPFVTAKQMYEDWVDIRGAPRLPKERAARLRIGFAKGGDVLISHNASVGKVVRAPVDAGDFLIGTSATYYRCNLEAIEPNFLVHFMKSELFQNQLRWIMKQTTRNQVSVMKQVNLWICLPPLDEQRRIVAYLNGLQAKVNELRELQSASGEELSALLPSILEKAFKGEL
jgi:type I restriction enzyme, S subunit